MRSIRILSPLVCAAVLLMGGSAWAQDTQARLRALDEAYRSGVITQQEYQQKRAQIEAEASNPEKQRRLQALEQARQAGVISDRDYQRKRAEILNESPRRAGGFEPGAAYTGNGWLLNGATVGQGNNAILARFGFPGLEFSVLHGVADKVDIGGQFNFTYAPVGIASSANVGTVGLALGPMFRLSIADSGTFNFGVRFTPQFLIAFTTGQTAFGVLAPVEFLAGVVVSPEFSLNFGLELQLAMNFTNRFIFFLPILPTVGLEYKVMPDLEIGLETAFGPAIEIASGASATEFAFRALIAIGYHF